MSTISIVYSIAALCIYYIQKNFQTSCFLIALEKITLDDSKNKKTAQDSSDEEEYVPKKVRLQRKRQKEKEKEIRERQKIPKASHNPWGQKVRNEGKKRLHKMLFLTMQ